MIDWLVKRLTPKKEKIERWKTLAETLQEIWEEFYDPRLQRLENMRSSYSIDERDLAKKIKEYGDYFNYDIPRSRFRALDLGWRRLELDFKEQEFILNSAMRRHFGGIFFEWLPIFAPQDLQSRPYGSGFIVSESSYIRGIDKNIPPLGYWLTSRGMLGVNLADLYKLNIDKASFTNSALPIVSRTKPLHIVFDGFCFFIKHDIEFPVLPVELTRELERYVSLFCSIIPLSLDERLIEREFISQYRAGESGITGWHLDHYLPEWICTKENLPMDFLLYGIEGDDLTCYRILHVNERSLITAVSSLEDTDRDIRRYLASPFEALEDTYQHIDRCYTSDFNSHVKWKLDYYLPELLCKNELLPLDIPLDGIEGDDLFFSMILNAREKHLDLENTQALLDGGKGKKRFFIPRNFSCSASEYREIDSYLECEWGDCESPFLDKYISFDTVNADFCSLDLPRTEYYE